MVASKRDWMKKSKLSFCSPSSGPSSSPSIKRAKLPEILQHLATLQTGDETDRHCDVAGNPTELRVSQRCVKGELLMTLMTTTRDTRHVYSSSERGKPSEKNECEVNASGGVVQNETTFTGKEEAIVVEKPEWKGLSEADMAARKVRIVPQENGPSEESDLFEYLRGPRKPQLIVEGPLTSFLDGRNVDLHSFLYCHDLEDERSCSSFVHEGPATGSGPACFANDRGRQYGVTRKDRPRCARARSSSSTSYESVTAVESEGQMKGPLRTTGTSSPHHLAVRGKPRRRCGKRATTWRRLTRDATLQRGSASWCQRYRSETHKSRSSKRGQKLSEVACAHEVHEHRDKIYTSCSAGRLSATAVRDNHRPVNEVPATATAELEVSITLRVPLTEQKTRVQPAYPRHRPVAPVDEKVGRSAIRVPVPEPHELAGRWNGTAALCANASSSHRRSPIKSKREQQI